MADRPLDLICIGRASVDLYGEQVGGRLEDMTSFAKYVGGCPANIAIGAARLGLKAALVTRVGDEHMGRFIRETLIAEGVDVSHVATDRARPTALVILGIRDRDTFPLIFYRENCADMAITAADIDAPFIASAKAVLVTGTHFSRPGVDAASRGAIRHARAAGTKVVLDIDYRPVLWGLAGLGEGERRFIASDTISQHLQSIVADCDLVVGTEEEIHIAGGSTDTMAALRRLRALSPALIVVKRGPLGCVAFDGPIPARIEDGMQAPGNPVEVFNVLGAGDAFMAGFLRGWLRGKPIEESCRCANAGGAIVVSRHGCAPAMPSWAEMADYLARAGTMPRRLAEDSRLDHLHRVTTRRGDWPDICALAFDHRTPFENLAERHRRSRADIARFKALIAEGARRGADGLVGAGAIIDDRHGADTLAAMTGTGWWLARPVELPGSIPVEFEAGANVGLALRSWPAEQVAKCLIYYHPDDGTALCRAQEAKAMQLYEACRATGHELLLEIIPLRDGEPDPASLPCALARFYEIGILPDWWKLPPPPDEATWRALDDTIRRADPHCRGVLLLGYEKSDDELGRAFALASFFRLCRGFAVGRSIFAAPAEEWFAGTLDDAGAIAAIAAKYRRVIDLWRAARHADRNAVA